MLSDPHPLAEAFHTASARRCEHMVKCPRGISQVKLVLRLLGAIWVSSLVIIAGFALVQIYAERDQILTDLERRGGPRGGRPGGPRRRASSGSSRSSGVRAAVSRSTTSSPGSWWRPPTWPPASLPSFP